MQQDQTYRYDERKVMEVVNAYLQEWHEARPWRGVATLLRNKDGELMNATKTDDGPSCSRLTQAYYAAAAIGYDPTLLPRPERAADPWWSEVWELLVGLSIDPPH